MKIEEIEKAMKDHKPLRVFNAKGLVGMDVEIIGIDPPYIEVKPLVDFMLMLPDELEPEIEMKRKE